MVRQHLIGRGVAVLDLICDDVPRVQWRALRFIGRPVHEPLSVEPAVFDWLLLQGLVEKGSSRPYGLHLTRLGQKVIERGRFAPPLRVRGQQVRAVRAA